MAITTEEIKLLVTTEVKKSLKDLKSITSELTELNKNSKRSPAIFDKLGGSWLKAGAVLTGVALAMKKAIGDASDLQEVTSKFGVVFEGNMDIASSAVDTLTQSYAMSTREARQYLSSVQDLLVPMGLNSTLAASMSAEIVKLSADLGSFNNLPTAQVMQDIQSGLVGNFETMKKYGVVLNETVVKQEAMNMGLYNGKGLIDASAKAQAAFQIILKGSNAAIGDMALTADSFANISKKLNANIEDLSAAVGSEMLPGASDLAGAFVLVTQNGSALGDMLVALGSVGNDVLYGLAKSILYLNQKITEAYQGWLQATHGFISVEEARNKLSKIANDNYSKSTNELRKILSLEEQKHAMENKLANMEFRRTAEGKKYYTEMAEARANDLRQHRESIRSRLNGSEQVKKTTKDEIKAIQEKAKIQDEIDTYIAERTVIGVEKAQLSEQQKFSKLREEAAKYKLSIEEAERVHQETLAQIRQEFEEQNFQKRLTSFNNAISATQQLTSKLSSIFSQYYKNRNLELDSEYKNRKKYIEQNITDENEKKAALEALDKEFDKKRAKLEYEQAKREKTLAVIQAIQATALGVTKALASSFNPIANIALASMIGALGAAQVAMIAAQPLPPKAEDGGIIKGTPGGTNIIAGERGKSEAIIPLEDSSKFFGGITVNINIENAFANEDFPEELAKRIDTALTRLNQDKNSTFARSIS